MATVINANLRFRNPLEPLKLDEVQYIIIHHLKEVSATPEQIHQWHLQNGWSGAGYGEYIRKDGTVYIMRGDNVGAHCADNRNNYNYNSYGIACEGNYDTEKDIPTAQFMSLVNRIKYHKSRLPALKKIGGHREFISTACPGRYFPLERVKLAVNANMPVLRKGSRGEDVKFLQIQLTRMGYPLVADGIFGSGTDAAVKQFQQRNGLGVDGVVGTFTWARLL